MIRNFTCGGGRSRRAIPGVHVGWNRQNAGHSSFRRVSGDGHIYVRSTGGAPKRGLPIRSERRWPTGTPRHGCVNQEADRQPMRPTGMGAKLRVGGSRPTSRRGACDLLGGCGPMLPRPPSRCMRSCTRKETAARRLHVDILQLAAATCGIDLRESCPVVLHGSWRCFAGD